MNLKNNKGYVITDISISIIILLILVPVIMGIVYGIDSTKRAIEIKTEALNIAVNTLEIEKRLSWDNSSGNMDFVSSMRELYTNVTEEVAENETDSLITIETNIAKYTVKVMRYQYNNTNTQSRKVTVTYNIKGQNKEINIETAEIM